MAGGREHNVDGGTIADILSSLETTHPKLRGWIVDESGAIRRHVNVFVNGERVAGDAHVEAADRIDIIGSIAGGADGA